MSDFGGNFNWRYNKASNIDDTGKDPNRIKVYVENEDDVSFWYVLFKKHLPAREIYVTPSTKGNLTRGKEAVLSLKDGAGEGFLLCVDSDYYHLVPDSNPDAEAINKSLYIFQTYAYSIENYRCFAPTLESVCVDASFNTEVDFDFVQFLQEYSECIYDLFLYSVYSWKKKIDMVRCKEDFEEYARIEGKPKINNNAGEALGKLRDKIRDIIDSLDKANAEKRNMNTEIQQLASELQNHELKIGKDNCYLFIHGHTLENVVLCTLRKIIPELTGQKIKQFQKEAKATQRQKSKQGIKIDAHELFENKKSEYQNMTAPKIRKAKKKHNVNVDGDQSDGQKESVDEESIDITKLLLDANKAYLYNDCPPLTFIERDINAYLKEHPIS